MAFAVTSLLPRRLSGSPKRRSRYVTPTAIARGNFARRTSIRNVTDVSELYRIARDVENSTDGVKVLALHARSQSEIIRVGDASGPLRIAWPLSAPAWPFNGTTRDNDVDHDDSAVATAVLATTQLESSEQAQITLSRLRLHLRNGMDNGELFAGVVLIDAVNPSTIHLLSIYDPEEGVLFDSELGDVDWSVKCYTAIHPPLSTWRATAAAVSTNIDDIAHTVNVSSRQAPKSNTVTVPEGALKISGAPDVKIPEGPGELSKEGDFAPKTRLLFGAGSIDGIAIKMREVANLKFGEVLKVFAVSGWNEARIQPLTIECEAPMENDVLKLVVGSKIFAGSVTIDKIRSAIERYNENNHHVIVGFGGGAVLDGAKAIAAFAPQSSAVVENAFEEIVQASNRGQREVSLTFPTPPLPAILINGTIGTGASLAEPILFTVESKDRHKRYARYSLFVTINYSSRVMRSQRERMAVVDSRIVSARRLNGQDAAQGGLLGLCVALDAAFSPNASPQVIQLAADSLFHGADYLFQSRIERFHSDGHARDHVLRGACGAALARDASGTPPIGLLLTVALMDSLVDGPFDGGFRWIYIRIMISVLRKCVPLIPLDELLLKTARSTLQDETKDGHDLAVWMLDYAERFGVPQLRFAGMTRNRARNAARLLAESGAVRAPPHPLFDDPQTLVEIVDDALDNQRFQIS